MNLSDQFLAGLSECEQVTFVSHVNPDPDSLGSMLGLAHLVEHTLGKKTRLTQDGLIGRAENRAMVDLLDVDLVHKDEVEWHECEAVVMVDSQPHTGRHSFDANIPIYAVIDHHDTPGDTSKVPFVDIRHGIGATCTLVAQYLVEQQAPITTRVATALLYGIETETYGYPREATVMDDSAVQLLYPLADKDLLEQIRNAQLPHSYFECMLQAMHNSFLYDDLIITWINDLPQPEMAPQVAEFLIRFEKVRWAFCAGICEQQMILSLRSEVSKGRAGEKLRNVVGDLGNAGGHERRAGGLIRLSSTSATAIEQIQSELRRRLLKVLDIDERRGQRLVPVREILDNIAQITPHEIETI